MGKIRGTHSSPGIYTEIVDLSYAAKTAGMTTLGLVGETEKGPAFEPIEIKDWAEFVDYFGGTNPEKFKDSLYPKYELPYIAKSYLKASDQMYVCRVLGLSGYNAGPAFLLTAVNTSGESQLIAVLRARGNYKKYSNAGDACNPDPKYDTLDFVCDRIDLAPYESLNIIFDPCSGTTGSSDSGITSLRAFTIVAWKGETEVGRYAVTLNSGAKDYIYSVLGDNPTNGTAALFVEELYDNLVDALELEEEEVTLSAVTIEKKTYNPVSDPVADFITIPEGGLKRKHLGRTFIFGADFKGDSNFEGSEGQVYKVVKDGVHYKYQAIEDAKLTNTGDTVMVLAYNSFVKLNDENKVDFYTDMSDYHDQFRWATTPWIVSELKGDANNIEIKKLFRFHTITDGNYANEQVKISIANIRPDEGTFDVLIRDFNDSDANPTILESYRGLTMVPGSSTYIGLKIGTFNGDYEVKSKYVMVEIIENDMTKQCVPCGFLGYPTRIYDDNIAAPDFVYNRFYNDEVKDKRQYFGLSDITGVDADMLKYKGKDAYTENYAYGYTPGFHLDSRIQILDEISGTTTVTVDGETGYNWNVVDPNNGDNTIIGSEEDMEGGIYENVKVRKFTVYPYGGFDGWDIYRNSRTNTDEFNAKNYKGKLVHGTSDTFSKVQDGTALALTGNCITSDYYAYLAGVNQFENPERFEINLFATPGVDYVNNLLLTEDIIDMIENRGDTFYVATTPDKPWGASDSESEMYSSQEAADNLEDAGVDTYYAATYYPAVKYFDKENNIFVNLPATKDALRIMANTDNKRYPWIAPAGFERAVVECQKMHFFAKLEDRDNVYDGRINSLISFSGDGVRIWGNKTMYKCEETNPMNRINTVRLVLYMKKILTKATRGLIFEPNDTTLKDEFESIVKPILNQIKTDRGITDYRLNTSQTPEQMDAHEMSGKIFIKPTPTLEYLELSFVVTPQGISFDEI